MRMRWKITLGLAALLSICGFLLLGKPSQAERELEKTRRSLRQQGFKTDLSDFNLATSPEESRRAAMLARTTRVTIQDPSRSDPVLIGIPRLLTPAGNEAALVIWKLEKLKTNRAEDLWPELRESFMTNQARLDPARQAALSGPIRFEPIGSQHPNALLPYLADVKRLETTFSALTILALHDGQKDMAWTNLLAATCLVTAYAPEPIDISQLVRLACASIAYETTWNALQSPGWTDARLGDLQRRWESVDFWSGMPETAAFARANMAATCQLDRQEPLETGSLFKALIHSPGYAWSGLRYYSERIRYRHSASYEDEEALLLYYRDRELELRRAIRCPTWSEMCQLPGVTNVAPFTSKHPSPVLYRMSMQQRTMYSRGAATGLPARAAEAQSRRGLIITAISLERYRARHGSYPQALEELVPELLSSVPIDFMDGKPLRYRRTDDGHFLLYSVGLDCVDNRGEMRRRRSAMPDEVSPEFGIRVGTDLVWPRPASAAEAERVHNEELSAEKKLMDRREELEAAAQWDHSAKRQAKVEAILQGLPVTVTNLPNLRRRLPTELLRNEETSGTNKLSLADMLTLHQVITGFEPELVTFELPISYDVLTNAGTLELYIDPAADADSDEGCSVYHMQCNRATNGNCLLLWSTIYESPGKHALQAGLVLNEPAQADQEFTGPLMPFVITNLCQFSLASGHFEREIGVTLRARLPESNATYVIELSSPSGQRLKTIAGSTSNSVIKVYWDLTDDGGNACTNDEFDTVFHITLPDSGRSQTLKGP